MEKKTIGTFLAALRKASGMTQKQLAEKLNVSDKAISRWERDECAPDLTLIPVLAEIYGVTADEILRGQRRDPEAEGKPTDKAKAIKQRQRLLSHTWLRFKVQSIISIAISIIGLIAASVCNFDLYQAHIGFMAGCVFFLTAGVCQVIFLLLDRAAIEDPEWSDDAVNDKVHAMVYVTEGVLTFIILLLVGCIPLAGVHRSSLPFSDWLGQCLGYLLPTASLCVIAVTFLNWKLGYLRSPKNKLRLHCGTALGICMILLILLEAGLMQVLPDHRHLYVPCTRHETRTDFLVYIETPLDPQGYPMTYRSTDHVNGKNYAYYQSDETGTFHRVDITQQQRLDPGDGRTPITGYYITNLTVAHVEISDTTSLAPIYTFTQEQYDRSQDIIHLIETLYPLLYLLAVTTITIVYLIKLRKLSESNASTAA